MTSPESPEQWTAYERETIVNLNDADDLVRIWTAQLHVIRRLRAHERFTEVASGEHWAEFTIPASEWNPATGVKHKRTYSPEVLAASRARMAQIHAARELSRHVTASDGASPVPEYPPTPESEFSS